GKLYWSHGRLARAKRQFRTALAVYPGYVYALDALAQVEAARGHYAQAIRLERRAVETIPLPQFVTTLGDLEHVTGHERLARRRYALIRVIQRLLAANGVKTDLENALFDVDHGVRLDHTLALARLARPERPSIDGDDVLAWARSRRAPRRTRSGTSRSTGSADWRRQGLASTSSMSSIWRRSRRSRPGESTRRPTPAGSPGTPSSTSTGGARA